MSATHKVVRLCMKMGQRHMDSHEQDETVAFVRAPTSRVTATQEHATRCDEEHVLRVQHIDWEVAC